MDLEIEIDVDKDFDLENVVLINAFPGPGYAAMLAANYIVDKMHFEPVGTVRSPYFPSTAIIHDYTPYHPMRFYGRDGIAVLITELAPKPEMAKPIAESLLKMFNQKKLGQIINLEAIADTQNKAPEDYQFFGITAQEGKRKELEDAGITLFKEGMVSGIAGELLSEGHRRDLNVICLLTEVNPMYPDVQAAIKFIENLNMLLEGMDIDVEDLRKEAGEIEGTIKESVDKARELIGNHQQDKTLPIPQKPTSYMYG